MWGRPPFALRTVLVTLKSDDETALRGVAWATRGGWLVLKTVDLIRPNQPPIRMDGEAIVALDNVAFLQVL